MVFNKNKKIAFVMPYKTGSNTIVKFLEPMEWKTLGNKHALTAECFERFPNLNNYTIYGFLRNPLLRFESATLYLKRYERITLFNEEVKKIGETVETISYQKMIDLFPFFKETKTGLFTILQSEWLNHPKVTVLDFDNFESELRRVTGYTDHVIPRENVATDFGKSVITDKVRAFVREFYAADYALAKDRLGKEYNP